MANINVKKQPSRLSKEQFYVDPQVLKDQITDFYQTEVCITELGESLKKIAEGLSFSPSFINYSYRDEMIGDALVKMYTALKHKKFNVLSETSPFCYFTTIAFHAFINRIKKEKKNHDAIEAYKASNYESMLSSGSMKDEGYHIYSKPIYDNDNDDDDNDQPDSDI
jgi:DNA-directed RNA polymerase specialized sigma24 family protein